MVDKVKVPLMRIELRMQYDEFLLLPYEEAAKLVALLGKASHYKKPYGDNPPEYASYPPSRITISPCDMDELAIIKQCAVTGISVDAYKESLNDES